VQCRWTQTGLTQRGVIGLPYTNTCECHNYESKPEAPHA